MFKKRLLIFALVILLISFVNAGIVEDVQDWWGESGDIEISFSPSEPAVGVDEFVRNYNFDDGGVEGVIGNAQEFDGSNGLDVERLELDGAWAISYWYYDDGLSRGVVVGEKNGDKNKLDFSIGCGYSYKRRGSNRWADGLCGDFDSGWTANNNLDIKFNDEYSYTYRRRGRRRTATALSELAISTEVKDYLNYKDKWHHVVVVSDGGAENNIQIYIDGVMFSKGTQSYSKFVIDSIGFGFKGKIDEVKIWKGWLDADSIWTEYMLRFTNEFVEPEIDEIDELNLIAYYPFEGNTYDYSGNKNHGFEIGDVEFVEGKLGNAAKFDEGDMIQLNDLIRVSGDGGAITYWYYQENDEGEVLGSLGEKNNLKHHRVFRKRGKFYDSVRLRTDDYLLYRRRGRWRTLGENILVGTYANQKGSWHHMAVVFNTESVLTRRGYVLNKIVQVYQDGVLVDSQIKTDGEFMINTIGLNWKGMIDEVKIWNGWLGADSIWTEYMLRFTNEFVEPEIDEIDELNLIAYYPFEGNTYDYSGNKNHGFEIGDVEFVEGKLGNAAKFDEGDMIQLNDLIRVSGGGGVITYWYYQENDEGEVLGSLGEKNNLKHHRVLAKRGRFYDSVRLRTDDYLLYRRRGRWRTLGENILVGTYANQKGSWHHMAVVFNTRFNQRLRVNERWVDLYQDGVLVDSQVKTEGKFMINTIGLNWKGMIDEVKVWWGYRVSGVFVSDEVGLQCVLDEQCEEGICEEGSCVSFEELGNLCSSKNIDVCIEAKNGLLDLVSEQENVLDASSEDYYGEVKALAFNYELLGDVESIISDGVTEQVEDYYKKSGLTYLEGGWFEEAGNVAQVFENLNEGLSLVSEERTPVVVEDVVRVEEEIAEDIVIVEEEVEDSSTDTITNQEIKNSLMNVISSFSTNFLTPQSTRDRNINFNLDDSQDIDSSDIGIVRDIAVVSQDKFDKAYIKLMSAVKERLGLNQGDAEFIAGFDVDNNQIIDSEDCEMIKDVLAGERDVSGLSFGSGGCVEDEDSGETERTIQQQLLEEIDSLLFSHFDFDGDLENKISDPLGYRNLSGTISGDGVQLAEIDGRSALILNGSGFVSTLSISLPGFGLGWSIGYWYKSAGIGMITGHGSNRDINYNHGEEDEWHHIIFSYKGGRKVIFKDGIRESDSSIINRNWDNLFVNSIGYNKNGRGNRLKGIFDELKVWRRQLTSQEVEAEYNRELVQFSPSEEEVSLSPIGVLLSAVMTNFGATEKESTCPKSPCELKGGICYEIGAYRRNDYTSVDDDDYKCSYQDERGFPMQCYLPGYLHDEWRNNNRPPSKIGYRIGRKIRTIGRKIRTINVKTCLENGDICRVKNPNKAIYLRTPSLCGGKRKCYKKTYVPSRPGNRGNYARAPRGGRSQGSGGSSGGTPTGGTHLNDWADDSTTGIYPSPPEEPGFFGKVWNWMRGLFGANKEVSLMSPPGPIDNRVIPMRVISRPSNFISSIPQSPGSGIIESWSNKGVKVTIVQEDGDSTSYNILNEDLVLDAERLTIEGDYESAGYLYQQAGDYLSARDMFNLALIEFYSSAQCYQMGGSCVGGFDSCGDLGNSASDYGASADTFGCYQKCCLPSGAGKYDNVLKEIELKFLAESSYDLWLMANSEEN